MDAMTLLVTLGMAALVLATRLGGYLLGLRWQSLARYRQVLEALPGCALMSLIFPALLHASALEIGALTVTVTLMWLSNNVALATLSGLAILVVGGGG